MLFYAFIKCLWASIVLPTKFTSCHLLNIVQSSLTKFKKKKNKRCASSKTAATPISLLSFF